MKTSIKYLTVAIVCAFVINSCKKKEEDDASATVTVPIAEGDVALTDSEANFLASLPDTFIRLEDIILEDGQNARSFLDSIDPGFLLTYPSGRVGNPNGVTTLLPSLQKELFLARMYAMGNYLSYAPNHIHSSGGANQPAQTKLAYSWGSKDYDVRQLPPTKAEVTPGCPGCNDLKIYGLDCTGMIWSMAKAAYLLPSSTLPKNNFFVSYITKESRWTSSFNASAEYKDLKMVDKGQLLQGNMKNGDIILWKQHVGIYLYGKFYQSNGTPCAPGCNNNLSQGRGPRLISLADVLSWGLGSYRVFRVEYGLSHTYTLTIAADISGWGAPYCALGNYIDSTIVNFTVITDTIGFFHGTVELNDYANRTPAFTYNSTSCNCLNMSFSNASYIDYTDFHFRDSALYGLAVYFDFAYTICDPDENVQCLPDPAFPVPGGVYSNTNHYTVNLPTDEIPVVYTSFTAPNSTLTIKRNN